MSVGEFFAGHRKDIDARKAHLARVGVMAPDAPPLRDAMPSQADVLVAPPADDIPLLDATHKPTLPRQVIAEYETPKLPKLPGVNTTASE